MNNLVFKSENGKPVTNSLLVAEKFEKRHADVIRSIENSLEINAKLRLHCVLTSYADEQGKEHPYVQFKNVRVTWKMRMKQRGKLKALIINR